MNIEIPREVPEEVLVDNLILLGYRGSVAHNMYIPNSDPNSIDDIDIMGVFLARENFYVGLGQAKAISNVGLGQKEFANPQTIEIMKEVDGVMWDCVYYELRKFIKLLLRGNPNTLNLLWIKPEHYLMQKESGKTIVENRNGFLGKNPLYDSFTGYADGQLRRMTHFKTEGYMGKKRKKLIEKYGYDTKNAAHLIRLLTMGIEALNTNKMKIFRDKDVNTLLDIKTGKWSLKKVKNLSKKLFKLAKKAHAKSTLPNEPDYLMAERITMKILVDYITKGEII